MKHHVILLYQKYDMIMSLCLSIHPSIHLSVHTYLSIHTFIHPSIYPPTHPSKGLIRPSIHPFFHLSIHSTNHPALQIHTSPLSIHPSIHPFIQPFKDLHHIHPFIPTITHSFIFLFLQMSFVATLVNRPVIEPFLFTNYQHHPDRTSNYRSRCNVSVWKAVMASTAAPGYFEEVKLENYILQVIHHSVGWMDGWRDEWMEG